MGQLEKYGLYVLCLVIFLILGVAIWGGEPARAGGGPSPNQLVLSGGPGSEKLASPPKPAEPAKKDLAPTPLDDLLAASPRRTAGDRTKETGRDGGKEGGKEAGKPESKDGSAPAAPPAADTVRPTHKVKHGDTLEEIARERLGSKALAKEILRLNPKVEPTLLRVGKELVLPSKAELRQLQEAAAAAKAGAAKTAEVAAGKAAPAKVEPAPAARSYQITKGDTFAGIAKRLYGSEKRADAIKELNPNLDPSRLRVGQTIRLPAD